MSKFPENLRVGETLEIVIRSKVTNLSRPDLVYLKNNFFTVDQDDVVSVKVIPKPIDVGDVVAWGAKINNYKVLAINDDTAWLRSLVSGGYTTQPVSILEHA